MATTQMNTSITQCALVYTRFLLTGHENLLYSNVADEYNYHVIDVGYSRFLLEGQKDVNYNHFADEDKYHEIWRGIQPILFDGTGECVI